MKKTEEKYPKYFIVDNTPVVLKKVGDQVHAENPYKYPMSPIQVVVQGEEVTREEWLEKRKSLKS